MMLPDKYLALRFGLLEEYVCEAIKILLKELPMRVAEDVAKLNEEWIVKVDELNVEANKLPADEVQQ